MEKTATLTSPKFRVWSDTKDKVIEALGVLFCGTPYDIARYVRGRKPSVTDIRSINRTLKNITEFDPPKKFWTRQEYFHRSATHLYGLDRYGAQYARRVMGIPQAREFDLRDVEHEHILTRCHLTMREFAAEHGFTMTWKQEAIDYTRAINPDAVMTLTTPDKTLTFTIEPERQTFNENLLKKAKKYYDVFEEPEAVKQFGSEKFRVVFLVLSERKRQTLLEKLAEQYPYRMFFVATVEDFTKNPEGAIFKTPKDYAERSYSFLDL